MCSRKELKKRARKILKKQYLIFVLICLISAFIGSEFRTSLTITKLQITLPYNNVVIENPLQGPYEEGRKFISKKGKELWKGNHKQILGRKRGVFASIVNAISTGSLMITITNTLNSLIGSKNITMGILILFSFSCMFALWFFVINIYQIISRRLFLEGREYQKVPIPRFLFLLRLRKWTKASVTMFLTTLFKILWFCTIIGGVVKRYSYYLVPYIVAENPDIPSLEAITLSRKMMNGYKWQIFTMECSFLGWELLGILTFGLSKIFYSNPYMIATGCEYYSEIRRIRKKENLPGTEYLTDEYLFQHAPKEILDQEYADVLEILRNRDKVSISKQDFKTKTMKLFGIALYNSKKEQEFEKELVRLSKIDNFKDAQQGQVYPTRLCPIPERKKYSHIETINYLRHYSMISLIILFFSFSFIGWLWEVILHLITDGEFVNRGTLHGPWLPIYGFGSIMILTILYQFRKKPLLEFISIITLCGTLEYFTSYYLEVTQAQRWWDYSGYFINLNGRICAEGLLVFGLGGIIIIYLVAPLLDNHIRKISNKILIPICIILIAIFTIDQIYSLKHPNTGKGISKKTTTQINRKEIDNVSDSLITNLYSN